MDYDQTERPPSPGAAPLLSKYSYITTTSCSGPTDVKVSILIRSMGPISDTDMVSECEQLDNITMSPLLQHYSMDCYFRQYWRDSRLSFKGLKMNSNQLHINQLSLNVKMLGNHWH